MTTRIVDSANAPELAKPTITGCVLCKLDFPSGLVTLCDGLTQVTYGGNVYLAVGQFGGIDIVEEGTDMLARPIKLTLSGVDASIISNAETDVYQGREATVYVGMLDHLTGQFVGNPEIAWEGRMDYMEFSIDQNKGRITLNCESRLRREPKIARYTDIDQQNLYSGDTFFNFQLAISHFSSQWGNQKQVYGGPQKPYVPPYKYSIPGMGGYTGYLP